MGAVLRFCAYVMSKAWRLGWSRAVRIANWAKANYVRVYRWILEGIAWDQIIEWIIRYVG